LLKVLLLLLLLLTLLLLLLRLQRCRRMQGPQRTDCKGLLSEGLSEVLSAAADVAVLQMSIVCNTQSDTENNRLC
jgi:hypothetical protein